MANFETTLKKLQSKYRSRFLKLFKTSKEYKEFVDLIKQAKDNSFSSISRVESRKFDETWIQEIERGIVGINNIINNPKRFIKFQSEVVPIEMAKKTGSESIRHLAMNSQYIKQIDEKGTIMPEKILNISTDDDLGIYENRFVVTLIRKLVRFIELRHDYIQKKAEVRDSDLVFMKSRLEIEGSLLEYEGKLRLSVPSAEDGNKEANDLLLKRIVELRQRVIFLLSSEFMRTLKDATPVNNPINVTNILKSNADYIKCYELWKFLDRYDQLGVSFQIKETTNQFNDSNLNDLYAHIGASYLAIDSERTKKIKVKNDQVKKYKVHPHFDKPILTKDLTDDKFLSFDEKKKVSIKTLTLAQEVALKKRREEAEKRRKEKEAQKAKERQKLLERREKEKERQRLAAIEAKKRAEAKRLEMLERSRLKALEDAERKKEQERQKAEAAALKKLMDEERKKLLEARRYVKWLANEQRKSENQAVLEKAPISEEGPEFLTPESPQTEDHSKEGE
ncbi:MAG TPA: hypothetical protein DCM23_00210 [Firmicutes bacterium]|jgi:hypothetical protein|nr:hypothetical protein [Bacillota bacterium]